MTPAPKMLQPDVAVLIAGIVDRLAADRSRLMDVLQAVQQRLGYLSPEAIHAVASRLGLHVAEVEDMASFYAFLSRSPTARFHIRLARTPISLLAGAEAVADAFRVAIANEPAGDFALDWTSDIGMADQEPSALINGHVLTRLTPDDAGPIIAALRTRSAANTLPLFPGLDAAGLPKSDVGRSLVQSGSVIFRPDSAPSAGLHAALRLPPEEIVRRITAARLRGRGGAGFPTGLKWKLCRQSVAEAHHVVCNADEGEPGTFKDRVLLRETPDLVFDGMTIAAHAIGARAGVVYLRGEYAYLYAELQAVLERRRQRGLLGRSVGGLAGFDFDIRLQLGAGAYICGEESALIESLEGKRGAPRDRPPFPTDRGYNAQPTIVDNVETFACAARIIENGAEWFAGFGTRESTGTKLLSVSGDCAKPGVYEVPWGISINELLDLVGAPNAAFVQVGGPSGQCVGPKDYGRQIAFEDLPTGGSIMVFAAGRDVLAVAEQFSAFFAEESCGWCTPCRVGTTLLKHGMTRLLEHGTTLAEVKAMQSLAGTVTRMSRCGLGQTAANPILTTMRNFPDAWEARLRAEAFAPRVDLRAALAEAEAIQGPSAEGAPA